MDLLQRSAPIGANPFGSISPFGGALQPGAFQGTAGPPFVPSLTDGAGFSPLIQGSGIQGSQGSQEQIRALLAMLIQLLQQLTAQQGATGAAPGPGPAVGDDPGGTGIGGGTADAAGFGKKAGLSGGGGGTPVGTAGNGGGSATQNAPTQKGGAAPSEGGQVIPYNGKQVKPLESYRVTSEFGPRWGKQHTGIDLAAPQGTAVRSFRDGEVVRVANDPNGYGNYIDVKHPDGTTSRYAHLSAQNVQVGQKVGAGSTIGKVGSTGNSTGPHLHFEVRDASGKPINPRKVMNF